MESIANGPGGKMRVSRRTMLGLMLSASGAALLAACTPQAPARNRRPHRPSRPSRRSLPRPPSPAEAAKPAAPAATTAPAAPAAAAKPTEAAEARGGRQTGRGCQAGQAAKPGETPKAGGTLRWGMVGDIVTTDAVLWSPAANETCGQVCDTLFTYDDALKPIPASPRAGT